MPTAPPFITRFAPSPTGHLHLGHAYAALVAVEVARAGKGRTLLRIEDLDRGRARAEFEAAIFEDLDWLGLTFDPAVMRQSERMAAYDAALERLDEMGLVYPCFCTRADLRQAEALNAPHESEDGTPFGQVYPGTCRSLDADVRARRIAAGKPHAMRLDMGRAVAQAIEDGGRLAFFEAISGGPHTVLANPEAAGDIVLARKDLGTSYHLAVVVDDAAQGVAAVTRGEDLLASTHIHVLLQRLLGLPTPAYGHHALVRDAAGKRLAKRDDAKSIRHLRNEGLSREAVLALLPPLPDLAALTSR